MGIISIIMVSVMIFFQTALVKMTAVQEQQRRFGKLKSTFAKRLSHNLNSLFIQQVSRI